MLGPQTKPLLEDMVLYQGSTFEHDLRIKENISDYAFASQMRKHHSSVNATATFTCLSLSNANGVVRVSLSNNVTRNIAAGSYVYDMHASNSTVTIRVADGIVRVLPGVTR